MKLLAHESIVDLLSLIGSAVGAAVVTIVGVLTEQAGIQNVLTGQAVLGAWELWMGTVALFFGLYLLGYRQFWQRLQLIRHSR